MALVGNKAPSWEVTVYDNGEKKTLSSYELAGSWYVLFFWPFDFTGICNSEVAGFEKLASEFESLGVQLIGASCDSFFSHQKWFESEDFEKVPSYPVLADHKHKVSKKFKVYSKGIGCAFRSTFLVNPDGIVMSESTNFLSVARDPQDVLTTTKAFVSGKGCTLPQRSEL
jgi:alkyl hydroperoxide reductase subunit AhpC